MHKVLCVVYVAEKAVVCAYFSYRVAGRSLAVSSLACCDTSPAHGQTPPSHPLLSPHPPNQSHPYLVMLSVCLHQCLPLSYPISLLLSCVRVFVPSLCLVTALCAQSQTWRSSNRRVVRRLIRSRRTIWCKRDCTSLMAKKGPRLARATFASSVSLWCVLLRGWWLGCGRSCLRCNPASCVCVCVCCSYWWCWWCTLVFACAGHQRVVSHFGHHSDRRRFGRTEQPICSVCR